MKKIFSAEYSNESTSSELTATAVFRAIREAIGPGIIVTEIPVISEQEKANIELTYAKAQREKAETDLVRAEIESIKSRYRIESIKYRSRIESIKSRSTPAHGSYPKKKGIEN